MVKTSETTTVGKSEYSIPYRAIGRTLRDLKLVDSTGQSKRDLNMIALEDEHMFLFSSEPEGFYFMGDKIILVPAAKSNVQTLEKWWLLPPGKFVKTSDAAQVTAISSPSITVNAVPSTISTGTVIDFIAGKSGNETLGMDVTVSNISGTTLTFAAADIPDDLAVGDWISVAETSPVLQIPNETHKYLETETAFLALKAIGDMEAAEGLMKEASEEIKNVKILLEPRIVGEQTKIINRRSLLRGARTRYRRGFTW